MRLRDEDSESRLTAKNPNRHFAHRPAHHHPKSKTVLPSSPQCFNGKANSLARYNIFFDGELRTPVPLRQAFGPVLRRPARSAAANRLRTLFISPPGPLCISSILEMVNTPGRLPDHRNENRNGTYAASNSRIHRKTRCAAACRRTGANSDDHRLHAARLGENQRSDLFARPGPSG
jgi:hypothetical protein